MNFELKLRGKRILVTGGARGLGKAICLEFAKQGANVAFNFSKSDDAAEQTKAEILKLNVKCLSFKNSVSDSVALQKMAKAITEEWGGVDILINNAGVSQPLPFALMEEEDWDAVMNVNLKGVFLTTKAILRIMMKQKKGAIINIGSLAGTKMIEAPVHYYTSKAAVKGFTEALAKEISSYGVRVLCLAPGLLEDGVARNLPDYKMADYLKYCSLGRIGTLEEVAKFACFMASDLNSYMSGETILIDGGI
jgi:3-oxoacyl-[acyl-carrier protein] reductase